MDRLTREILGNSDGKEFVMCNHGYEDCNDYCMNGTCKWSKKAYKKLWDYENTGLTPEEILDGKLLTGWIEVEERSPEDGQTVIASDGKYVYLVEYDADLDAPFGDMDGIIEWMPRPEPSRPD